MAPKRSSSLSGLLAGYDTWSKETGEGYDVGWIEVLLDQRQTHQAGFPARGGPKTW